MFPSGCAREVPLSSSVTAKSTTNVYIRPPVAGGRFPFVRHVLDRARFWMLSHFPDELEHLQEIGPIVFADRTQKWFVHRLQPPA